MRWTQEQYEAYTRKEAARNQAGGAAPCAQPEPPVHRQSVGAEAREDRDTSRVHVRIVSYRRRLCDPDNLCPKYFVDCLRYAEIIKDDRPQDIELSVSQIKVSKSEDERTEILITPL